jgi:hypothetical protein
VNEDGVNRVVFYGHEVVGEEIARRILERLRYSKLFIDRCAALVRQHMFRYEHEWKASTVRRFIARIGVDQVENLFALREADCRSRNLEDEIAALGELRGRVGEELRERASVHINDLAIDGSDVMRELGIGPGRDVGRVLHALLDRVLEEPELNQRDALLRLVQDFGDRSASGK